MDKLNCLIVDDEELARNLVENYINRLPHLHILGKCSNPLEAMHILQNQQVDLLFLDIQMPELTGVEFLKTLPQKPLVIFTTAYKEYALEGYQLDVVDYLLKPFRFERFLQAVNKASKIKNLEERQFIPLQQDSKPEKDYLLVKSEFKVYRIYYRDIRFVQSMKEYVAYYTTNQGRILSLGSLKKLEQELPAGAFMRVHKSYIVATGKVNALDGGQLLMGETKIPIGASYREEVLKKLF